MAAGPRALPSPEPASRLPWNGQAERAAVGACLLDAGMLAEVASVLRPEDLFGEACRLAYRAALDLADRGEPLDGVTIAEELIRRGEYDRLGGDDGLAEITGAVGSIGNALHYAAIVRDLATRRRLVEAAGEIGRSCESALLSSDELVALAESRVFAVGESASAGGARPAGEFLAESRRRYEARRRGERGGLPTGLGPLDEILDGLHGGGLYVLAARPSMGKTALGLNVAEHAAFAMGVPALVVSLEMKGDELTDRLVVSRAGVDGHRYRTGRGLNAVDLESIDRAFAEVEGAAARVWIEDTSGRSVAEIASEARRRRRRDRVGLVVVDYLQLVDSGADLARGASRDERVARITGRLKGLAKELGVPVLLLSQLNREVDRREDHVPRLSDLRESGAIEQDADVVMFIYRPEVYRAGDRPGEADLVVAKNRNGRTGMVRLVFLGALGRFAPYHEPINF